MFSHPIGTSIVLAVAIILILLLVRFRFPGTLSKMAAAIPSMPSPTIVVTAPSPTAASAFVRKTASTTKLKSVPWGWIFAAATALLIYWLIHWNPFGFRDQRNEPPIAGPAHSSSAASAMPDAPVSGAIQAPPNGSFDPMDDAKTMAGNFSAPINLISQRGKARKLSFNEDSSLPAPNPANVPWVAKCWPTGGGEPFILNGSDGVGYHHCAFASKTDQPVKIPYWLIDD